jgi:hypothetical protein
MKTFKVYAESIVPYYIVVEAENKTEAYLKATKTPKDQFSFAYEVKHEEWHTNINDMEEILDFPTWIMEHHSKRFSADLTDAMEDTDLQDDYMDFYGLSERDML